ncbi:MAG: GNAT family N-acetyltransferase [Caldithrix sp.]|nr:GNAT family N-acetyltransferase [Caldithrix sp.]
MDTLHHFSEIDKEKQKQILKLVTNSFYRELVNYGIDNSDIVTVSVNLLDFITHSDKGTDGENGYYNEDLHLSTIGNHWTTDKRLNYEDVYIKPLSQPSINVICEWLKTHEAEQTFIRFFPPAPEDLQKYLLNKANREYFEIHLDESDHLVGIIGAQTVDTESRKIEMKKFIGETQFRGKGIAKKATLLFLYYAFEILSFNKVFIHSLDTNIKNINLNSRFGFDLEGILYKEVRLNDKYVDVLRMSLLRDTWKEIFCK